MILQQNYKIVCAGEVYDESGKYRLKVWLADPAYAPKVPKLSDENIANKNGKPVDKNLPNDITVNFRVALELKDPQRGFEDVHKHAKNTTRTVTVTGDGFSIKKVDSYSNPRLYSDEYRKFTYTQKEQIPRTVQTVTRAFEAGTKTVTLNIKTTINDIELETSETLEFFVPNYIFDVFIKNGTSDDEGIYVPQKDRKYDTVLEVGHAAWAIEVYPKQLEEFGDKNYANHVWGSGPQNGAVLVQALWNFADNNSTKTPISVSVPGQLYKDGDQGTERIRFAFDDTKNANDEILRSAKAKAEFVLSLTKTAASDPVYQYAVPDLNCVVQVILALKVADLPMPNAQITCDSDFTISFRRQHQRKDFHLHLPIPKKFLKQLEALDKQNK
ncbi:MAG: hypothetical protein LBJ00_02540 [Planctomycetaceae bacterium]|jgi:hypothetical protein|nr:hypothetical protein [Planctomycetaceae bacterium]